MKSTVLQYLFCISPGYITCCAIHEQCVITGSSDSTIRKWFIATAECLAIYTGHSSRISRLMCVGHLIFSTSSDHTARAWLFDLSEISDEQGEACIKIFEVILLFYVATSAGSRKSGKKKDNDNIGNCL